MARKPETRTPIDAVKHRDKRTNIPTEELRDFVADEERQPRTVLYPRDASLDPQLVWKGKDEQDQHPLEVPAVPIYIQEKISPQAIIENVRANRASADSQGQGEEEQLSLFADFNNITFEDLVDFYHHEQNWSNRMILGDSLLVMTSLAEKENLKGQVQMIYIDPPYGIKFGSNWQVSTRKRDVKDGKAEDITPQPEQIKAFRDTWQLGIHSYLAYLRDRFTVARNLLSDSWSIFLQIGDENVHLVRSVLDEVFGSENFYCFITFIKTTGQRTTNIPQVCDYILWYAKDMSQIKYRQKFITNESEVDKGENDKGFTSADLTSINPGYTYVFSFQGREFTSGNRYWTIDQSKLKRLEYQDRLYTTSNTLRYKRYESDFGMKSIINVWTDTSVSGAEGKIYVVQTAAKVIERCLIMATDPGDLVLDPTCGSGTTAYVAEQWGRRWITIDTSRVAVALARTRLMAGRYPYYLLADSADGRRKEMEVSGRVPDENEAATDGSGDIRRGFVYKRVPHITLKSIANNEEIDDIHGRWQAQMDLLRARINAARGQAWEEWEMPRELDGDDATQAMLAEWWAMRRQRQAEIDESIARRAEVEVLVDQPYEDNKRVRVSGPFTVESLSPHRVLAVDEGRPESEKAAERQGGAGQFERLILDNLRTSGVQNTRKNERLKFTRLEAYAGVHLHAVGEYDEKDGTTKRAAVCIGPERGTVGAELIKEAAKEAVQGVGFDLLVVLGFAFDPHVGEETKRYGSLAILPARMNPDLQMGDLLVKSGSANLFTVFGEPDLSVDTLADGKVQVTIRGVDIFDPTTRLVRSSSTDEVACWFIDTDYNGESFFVRQAYFTGADEPYEKLKRALRADINEAAWSQLYTTTSMPFEKPKSGKIAVKVINHYGDEVMQVLKVG